MWNDFHVNDSHTDCGQPRYQHSDVLLNASATREIVQSKNSYHSKSYSKNSSNLISSYIRSSPIIICRTGSEVFKLNCFQGPYWTVWAVQTMVSGWYWNELVIDEIRKNYFNFNRLFFLRLLLDPWHGLLHVILQTSDRIHGKLLRLLYLIAHRQAFAYIKVTGQTDCESSPIPVSWHLL